MRHAVDERAETHLQVAALALASHKALLPYLRDEGEVLQIIQEHMGGRTQALLRFLLRATRPLQRDGYATLTGRLRGLQLDMGRGFDSSLELGQAEVRRCCVLGRFNGGGLRAVHDPSTCAAPTPPTRLLLLLRSPPSQSRAASTTGCSRRRASRSWRPPAAAHKMKCG